MVEELLKPLVEEINWLVELLKLLVYIGGAVIALRKWLLKPVEKIQKDGEAKDKEIQKEINELRNDLQQKEDAMRSDFRELKGDIKDMRKEMATAQDDIADVLGNELEAAYQRFTRQGWCPPAEKHHFVSMHQRYSERGHNHLVQHYEEDLLDLPDYPTDDSSCNG